MAHEGILLILIYASLIVDLTSLLNTSSLALTHSLNTFTHEVRLA